MHFCSTWYDVLPAWAAMSRLRSPEWSSRRARNSWAAAAPSAQKSPANRLPVLSAHWWWWCIYSGGRVATIEHFFSFRAVATPENRDEFCPAAGPEGVALIWAWDQGRVRKVKFLRFRPGSPTMRKSRCPRLTTCPIYKSLWVIYVCKRSKYSSSRFGSRQNVDVAHWSHTALDWLSTLFQAWKMNVFAIRSLCPLHKSE